MTDPSRLLGAVTLAFAMGTAVTTVSHYLDDRHSNKALSADHQFAILERRPFQYGTFEGDVPEYRNRILVPVLLTAAQRVSPLSPADTYVALRFAISILMFAGIAVLAARASRIAPLIATSVLALVLILTFNHPFELPTDYTDVIFTTLFVTAAQRGSRPAVFAAAILGATARESAAFAGIVWICCAPERTLPRWAYGLALSLSAMTTAIALRFFFRLPGGRLLNSVGAGRTREWIANAIASSPGPRSWWVALAAGAILLTWWLKVAGTWSRIDRKLLTAAAVIGGISVIVGTAYELRIYVPVATCILLAGLAPQRDTPTLS